MRGSAGAEELFLKEIYRAGVFFILVCWPCATMRVCEYVGEEEQEEQEDKKKKGKKALLRAGSGRDTIRREGERKREREREREKERERKRERECVCV